MNKTALIQEIVARLESELALYAKSARAAHEEATHEQSKAENKYDTRGLEASYLARGQSQQAAETELARQHFESLTVRDFTPDDPIDLTALVALESVSPGAREAKGGNPGSGPLYFIGPRAGGMEISCEGAEVLVITPQSPLGSQLKGRKQGERFSVEIGGSRRDYRVVSVW